MDTQPRSDLILFRKGTVARLLWGLSLLISPVTIIMLAVVCDWFSSLGSFTKPPPWTWHLVENLGWFHMGLSVVAAVVAIWLFPRWPLRLLAWFVVLVMLWIEEAVGFAVWMGLSGMYL